MPPPSLALDPSFVRTRISNLLDIARPLALGILAAAISKAAVATQALPDSQLISANMVIAIGAAIPLLSSLAVSFGQTLWIDITGQNIRVRRFFAPERVCRPRSLVFWGFKRGLGIWSTVPPRPEIARRTRFKIETAEGYRAEASVATQDAPWIADLMQQRLPGEKTMMHSVRT